ncbi:hypothetical protein [Micromonospora sp. WMMC250]|uniref:hypothetical protein n=1 Tax=Micromonospora sp. WMMC250 TaxID=3014781 RepID=UPI0022B5F5C9|nr:hypothetical protein [Micromonospora sp. WMMC250]MCZ7374325.1 hypothetical protein [Micromonospora sp. WMMC250]
MSARTILRVAAVVSALGAALVVGAAPATAQVAGAATSAAACSAEDWGPYDWGYAYTVSGKSSPLRTGPYSGCSSYSVPANTEFSIDCRLYNDAGNLWYHGEAYVNGQYRSGWMFSGNLTFPSGSNFEFC